MSFLQDVYDKSPIFFQNLMTSIAGYQKNRSRYGEIYNRQREFLTEFDNYSLEKQLEYQKTTLNQFVQSAYKNSKFYKQLYKNIDVASIKTVEDLKKLPIVDKETLRRNIIDVNTIKRKDAVVANTGGTTGKSLEVFYTKEDMMKRMAHLDHFKSRVGFENLKMHRATFNGQHIIPPTQKRNVFWRYNAPSKQMIYSSFHITERNLEYYIKSLNQFKPDALDGFFTSMLDVANYIDRHQIKLDFQPIAIFPTSETLTESGRELLERVFNCKVYDQYASSEGAHFVTECVHQNYHFELGSGVFEHFAENNDEILVTSFTTNGTPLIRYRIGDAMTFEDPLIKCECGSEAPLVKEIKGRKLDFLYTSKGAKINGGNIANIFKNIPNAIIRAQLKQDKMNEIKVLLEIDQSSYKNEYDSKLEQEIIYKFGSDTKVIIEHVNEIPREKSGKFRIIKNNISK